jgi:nitrate/nitrite transporter NarK
MFLMAFVPQYRLFTQHFGGEMAFVTRAALACYPYVWLLPVVVLVAYGFWPQRHRRALAACLIGVVGAAFTISLALAAWFWPIFRLGALVG